MILNKIADLGTKKVNISNNQALSDSMKGSRFEQMLAMNPYNNSIRQQSWWEKLLGGLGFRTNYDKDMEQLQQASAEYQAQIAQLASEDKYNTPAEQAARMRQAGLNPDLTGVSGEPASEFDNQQASPEFSGSDQDALFSGFQNLSSLVLGAFGTAESLMQSIGTMTQLFQNIRSGSLDQANKIFDTVSRLHGVIMGDESITKDNIEFNPSVQALLGIIPNRKMRKKVQNYLIDYDSSLQKRLDSLNVKTNVENKRKEYNSLLGSHTYSSNDETMQGLFKILSDGQYEATTEMYKAEKAKYKAETSRSEYDKNLAEQMNKNKAYITEASAMQSQNEASISDSSYRQYENDFKRTQLDVQKHILDTYKKALDFLHEEAKKGNLFAGLLSFGLGNMSIDWKSMLGSTVPGFNMISKVPSVVSSFRK